MCASEFLVYIEDQLLSVYFAVAVVFVDFEESLVVVGLCLSILKFLLAGKASSLPLLKLLLIKLDRLAERV